MDGLELPAGLLFWDGWTYLTLDHDVVRLGDRDGDGRFEVRTAGTGYDAGMVTTEFKPHLILLDYMLPDVNGNVVCKTIRGKEEFADTKIIIVSGVVNQDEIDDLMKAGADDFVKKPFNIEKLIERIGQLLAV